MKDTWRACKDYLTDSRKENNGRHRRTSVDRRFTAWILAIALCLTSPLNVLASEEGLTEEADVLIEEETTAESSEDTENAASEQTSAITVETIEEVDTIPASTGETDGIVYTDEITYINPLYSDVIDESDLNQPSDATEVSSISGTDVPSAISEDTDTSSVASTDTSEYYDSIADAADAFRKEMENRSGTITICYESDSYDSSIAKAISSAAMEHTGVADEGDYLKFQYGGYTTGVSYYTSNGVCYITFTYTMTYYTTLEQETAVTSALSEAMSSLNLDDDASDYTKVCAIYNYICQNVTYDYDNLEDTDYTLKYTAYAALINGTSVCQGYAVLLYRMLLMAGLDTRVISGTGNGGAHAWNIVKVNGSYYDVDATWDAVYTDLVPLSYQYFLKCDANFADHTRGADYSTTSFTAAYSMGSTDYELSEEEAAFVLDSGSCGDNLTWKVSQDGTLTISGSGEMGDFSSMEEVPWFYTRTAVTKIVIEEGVTSVGYPAFSNFTKVTSVSLPESLTTIGQFSFGYCTSLTDITIPASVSTIDYNVFSGCTSLNTIYFEGNAPTFRSGCFTNVTATAYYPTDNSTWTASVMQDYGGTIIWESYVKHEYDDGVITTAATCTTDGVMTYTCADCGDTYTEVIPATGHTEVTDAAVAATCTTTGLTEGSHCSVCGEVLTAQTVVAATGHSYDSGEVTTAATCTTAGAKTYTCTTCGNTYTETIPATGHTEVTDAAVAATCTTTGLTEGSHCSVCGEVLTAQTVVAATGHSYDSGEVTTAATCTTDGVMTYTCADCGDTYTEVIPATGHTEVTDAAVAATCTTTGLTEGSHCSVCGEVLTAQTVVAATGHSYDNGEVTTAATCTTDGVMTYTCADCGDTYTEVIPATGHTEATDEAVAATCTTTGLTEGSHCSVCGEVLVAQETIPAMGHSHNEGEVTTEATCTTDGVMTYTCTVCGESYTEVIPATGHTSDDGEITKEATCTEEGEMTYTCTVCKESYTEAIPATGHTAVTDAAVAATCTTTGLTEGSHCSVCGEVLVAQETIARLPNIANATATLSPDSYTYDGSAKTPSVTVIYSGKTLTKGTDYTVSYSGNTNAGTGTVTITGINSYGGTLKKTFTITKASQSAPAARTVTLKSGASTQLSMSAIGTVTYSTSNASVATVDGSGNVNAVGAGTAVITATAAGNSNYKSVSTTMTVTVTVPATSLKVARTTIYLKVKGTATISTIVAPTNTTDKVTFTSSKPSVVKVSSSGKITAKKAGTAKITVKVGSKKKIITVKVVKNAVKVTKLTFKKSNVSVKVGAVQFLSYTVKNAKATTQIKWKSSNSKVVSVDQNGKITAKKKGTAKITITANGKKATCKITVK